MKDRKFCTATTRIMIHFFIDSFGKSAEEWEERIPETYLYFEGEGEPEDDKEFCDGLRQHIYDRMIWGTQNNLLDLEPKFQIENIKFRGNEVWHGEQKVGSMVFQQDRSFIEKFVPAIFS